jgi:hypothetical protein
VVEADVGSQADLEGDYSDCLGEEELEQEREEEETGGDCFLVDCVTAALEQNGDDCHREDCWALGLELSVAPSVI